MSFGFDEPTPKVGKTINVGAGESMSFGFDTPTPKLGKTINVAPGESWSLASNF